MENNFYETEKVLEQQSMAQQGISRTRRGREDADRELLEGLDREGLARYTAKTFLNMFFGLLVSFGVAFFLVYTIPGYALFRRLVIMTSGYLPMILLVAQLLLSLGMSSAIRKSSVGTTWVFFLVHCSLIGFVVGTWLLVYRMESVSFAFAMEIGRAHV